MKIFQRFVLPSLIILFSLFVFRIFRVQDVSKLWKDYSVFCVPSSVQSDIVLDIFSDKKIDGIISLDNQYVPLNLPSDSPEVYLAMTKYEGREDYLSRRRSFFFDKSESFQIFYVPEKYSSKLSSVVNELEKLGITSFVNTKASYPFLTPLIVLAFAIFLTIYSEKRLVAVSLFFLPVCFSLFVPLYPSAASLVLLIYAIFLYLRVYGRRDAFFTLKKSPLILSILTVSLLLQIFSGIKSLLLFVILLFAEISMIYIVSSLEVILEKKRYSFVPVKIRSAKMIRLVNKRGRTALLSASALTGFVFLFALFSSLFHFSTPSSSKLLLPTAFASVKSLPDLKDFTEWRWEKLVTPYISLNSDKKIPDFGQTIYFSRYTEEDGKIKEEVSSITYNQKFRDESISSIDSLNFPAVEKMLKKQGKVKPGFASSGSSNLSVFSILTMIFAVIVPLFFYFFATKQRTRRG